jgi:hypothetical protein
MGLGEILHNVVDALTGNNQDQNQTPDNQGETYNGQQVYDASQDPQGDPADTYNGQQVLDASQDPLGDPADTYTGQQVLDASQDPLGDPADQR